MNNTEGTNYWFTEHGEWGTVDVEHVFFSTEHHKDIHESFDMVSDWLYPSWAVYLASRPHELDDNGFGCQTCETLATELRASLK